MSTAIDTGGWTNIHPPDKQFVSTRLANSALQQIYGKAISHRRRGFPAVLG
jgi:hypothetical protein